MTGSDLGAALVRLRRDGAVVYPTETFYGLGARALSPAAVAAVGRLKGRDAGKPIALIVADAAMLARVVACVPAPVRRLVDAFWPGPLTLVLPARADVPPALTGGSGMIGVRVSSHPIAHALVTTLGEPLTATSANPGGAEPARDVAAARRYFGDAVGYVDGGRLAGGLGSTVLRVADDAAEIIRRGATSIDALRGVLGTTPLSEA